MQIYNNLVKDIITIPLLEIKKLKLRNMSKVLKNKDGIHSCLI